MRRARSMLIVAVLVAVSLVALRRRRALAVVAPGLRHRMLWVPVAIRHPWTLRVARRVAERRPSLPVDGVDVRTEYVDRPDGSTVRVLSYERPDRVTPSGALVWIHGGGYILAGPEVAHAWCSRVAHDLGVLVVSVDYRLAPEHPFPAGLDDCFAALEWLRARAATLGVDPSRIAVGGDSAGGGLAAALAQMAHDRGGPPVAFQLLQYPMLDDRTALSPRRSIVWTNPSNRFAWGAYLGHPVADDESRPWAVPARRVDLTGLPPAWIGVGDIDLFHDEDVDYATRLQAAGVECRLRVESGMYHGADVVAPTAPAMVAFTEEMLDALRHAIG